MLINPFIPFSYAIDGLSSIATEFYPLEKIAKVGYRVIDLTNILKGGIAHPFLMLSSQFKDLILLIESTRFFCVSFPLFGHDNNGKTFFQTKTRLQCAEKLSITLHLALKALFGADRVRLIRLGIIGTYAIGYLPLFRWATEITVLMYNLFGAMEGATKLAELIKSPAKEDPDSSKDLSQWSAIQYNRQLEKTKACFKIAATVSKAVLIIFAVGLAAINFYSIAGQITILSLGILSDGIGLIGFYHQHYFPAMTRSLA